MMLGDALTPRGAMLARLTRDLTAEAREGRLIPVRRRDEEIAHVVDILLRQGKCNPVLVGAAGVGKTAIAEGLAQRIVAGEVPLSLRGLRVLALDHVSLLAGTKYRGQYEERIRRLIDETTEARDVVLFIDELHNLIGQGSAMGVAMDAANMLKPALVRGDFRVIGATTDDEYDRWIRADPALERRFQRVEVHELDRDATLEVLRARRDSLERHHHVAIADAALEAAVDLTDRHVSDRVRPDRAIDALDEACASVHARTRYTPGTERMIAELADARSAAPNAVRADDELDALARRGFEAIERFGAQLESVLGGAAQAPRAESRPAGAARRPRSVIEAELHRALIDDGVVVRPDDVSTVVSRMTGHTHHRTS